MMAKYKPEDYGKVVVLMGGVSPERAMSLASGNSILESLKRSGVDAEGLDVDIDVIEQLIKIKPARAFIALHGIGGEDGTIQGVLEYLGIPYTGSGVRGAAITMDETFAKLIWQSVGVPTSQFRLITSIDHAVEVMREWGFPLCVKPATGGYMSVVSKVKDSDQLTIAYNKAAQQNQGIIIEPWIEGATLSVGVLGTNTLPIIEVRDPTSFIDFDGKFNEKDSQYICSCSLSPERQQEIQALAFRAFFVTGCRGWGRVDLIHDSAGRSWFLKIKTVPEMVGHSLMPKAANLSGLSYDALVLEILAYTKFLEEMPSS